MFKKNLAISAILALAATLLFPGSPASFAVTVDKTFTVTDSDSQPYAGVSVALVGWDYVENKNVLSSLATTNSSGSAVVSIDPTIEYYGYAAQPGAGDYSHAVAVEFGAITATAQSFSIQMSPANFIIEMQTSAGLPANSGSWVHFPGNPQMNREGLTARPVLRSGPIPIDISTSILSSSNTSLLRAEPNGHDGQFTSQYGIKKTDEDPSRIQIFTDRTGSTTVSKTTVGSLEKSVIRFAASNFSGSLLSSNGEVTSFPSNTRIEIFKAKDTNSDGIGDGEIDLNASNSPEISVSANGNFESAIYEKTLGKYFPMVRSSGDMSVPSFIGAPFFIDSSGNFSLSQNGTFGSELDILLPFASSVNFKVRMINPLTSAQATDGYLDVNASIGDDWLWFGPGPVTTGEASFALPDGTYNIWLELDQAGTAAREYVVTVEGGVASVRTRWGASYTADVSGLFALPAGQPNLSVRIVNPTTGQLVPGIQVDLLNPNIQGDNFIGGFYSNDGELELEIPVGEFEVRLNVNSPGLSSSTYSVSNNGEQIVVSDSRETVVSPTQEDVYELFPGLSNVSGRVLQPNSNELLVTAGRQNVNIQLQKLSGSGSWDYVDVRANVIEGLFDMTVVENGTYRLRAEPWNIPDVTVGTSATFTILDGVSDIDGLIDIQMGSPSLKGVVLLPTGSSGIRDSEVVAVDLQTNQEMWEYSARTDSNGNWSMSLPAGEYSLYARAPWGNAQYGSSLKLAGISIDEDGQVSGPANPLAITLRLQNPTWSGKTVDPTDESRTLSDVSICFDHQEEGQNPVNTCVQSNELGNWAMSKPDGFVDFNDSSSVTVRENWNAEFAEARYTGEDAIEAEFGVFSNSAQGPFSGITISPKAPNAILRVTYEDENSQTQGAPNIWVSVDREDVGWLTGGMTDTDGNVKLYIPDIALGFKVNAHIENNQVLENLFTTTVKSFTVPTPVIGTFEGIVPLEVPNFRGFVSEPGSGDPVQNSWVEVFDEVENSWLGGSNSLANGKVSLKLPVPLSGTKTLRINVRPSWNNSSLAARTYFATVADDGSVVVKADSVTGTPIGAIDGEFPLSLAAPSLRGTVKLPTLGTPVRDSWINVISRANDYEEWLEGASTILDGTFALSVPDGTYEIFANAPWNTSTYAKSSRCSILIEGSQVDFGSNLSTCNADEFGVLLELNSPNLRINLKKGELGSGVAVANAHVNVSIGEYHTWAQSGRDGSVALFIDAAEVNRANSQNSAQTLPIRVHVDPPNGATDITRFECEATDLTPESTPICGQLSAFVLDGSFPATNPIDFYFSPPNSKVKVVFPGGTAVGRDAWVSLFVEGDNGWRHWVAGAQTNSSGEALFNLDPALYAGDTFSVEVNAPWAQRQNYSTKLHKNIAFADLLDLDDPLSLELQTPNLKLRVIKASSSQTSRWNWVELQKINSSGNVIEWLDGAGTDDRGNVAITLPNNSRVRLTVHPGPGSDGVRTSCVFTVTGSAVSLEGESCVGQTGTIVNGAMDFKLSLGNVVGTVRGGTGGLKGAIVYAQAYSDENTVIQGKFEQTVSLADGSFGLQLDAGVIWKIKVIYVAPEGKTEYETSSLQTVTGDLAGLISMGNIELTPSN